MRVSLSTNALYIDDHRDSEWQQKARTQLQLQILRSLPNLTSLDIDLDTGFQRTDKASGRVRRQKSAIKTFEVIETFAARLKSLSLTRGKDTADIDCDMVASLFRKAINIERLSLTGVSDTTSDNTGSPSRLLAAITAIRNLRTLHLEWVDAVDDRWSEATWPSLHSLCLTA